MPHVHVNDVRLFYEEQDSFRINAGSETFIADGGLSYDFGPARIILQATRYDQDLPGNRASSENRANGKNYRQPLT